jgi:hypothetical protein
VRRTPRRSPGANVVTSKICLRCEWEGETQERTCPSCGEQPLYGVATSPSEGGGGPAKSHLPEGLQERSRATTTVASAAATGSHSAQPKPSPPQADTGEPPGRSTRSTLAFIIAALVLTVTLGTWLKAHEERTPPAAPADAAAPASDGSPMPVFAPGTDSLVRIDATTGEILASVPIQQPGQVATDGRSVWVLSGGISGGTALFQVEAATNAIKGVSDVSGLRIAATQLAVAGGSAWLGNDAGPAYRFAPGAVTGEATRFKVKSAGFLWPVAAAGSLWVSCCRLPPALLRVDPATGRVLARIERVGRVVASGTGFLWAIARDEGRRLVRIDTETHETVPIGALGFLWTDLAVADGAVWASSREGDAIVRIDAITGEEYERILVEGSPGALTAGADAVWAAVGSDGAVARYDLDTDQIDMIDVGGPPNDLVFANGSVWVTVFGPAETPPDVPGTASGPFLLDLRTGEETPLVENLAGGTNFAASLDGTRLAFVGNGDEGRPQIFTAGIDGTGVRQMTHDPAAATWPTWSPDGTMIAYMGSGGSLFVIDLSTGESRWITDGVGRGSGLQFAPDGLSIVYTGGSDSLPVLLTVPVAGGESTIRFGKGRGGMADAGNGSLSPDGSIVTMMGSEIGGPGAIRFVANVDGTDLRHIPEGRSNPAGTWSPDGSRIVCSNYGGEHILVVDIATGEASRVADGSGAIWLDGHTLLIEA